MIQEFFVAGSKYTPAGRVTYCGKTGSLWTMSVLTNGAWRYMGTGFVPGHRPTRSRVIELVPVLRHDI